VTQVTRAGVEVDAADVPSDAVNDHYFTNNGRTYLLIRNVGGSPTTATIITPDTVISDLAVSVTNGTSRIVGPFSRSRYNQAGGIVHVDVTVSTDLELAAFKI